MAPLDDLTDLFPLLQLQCDCANVVNIAALGPHTRTPVPILTLPLLVYIHKINRQLLQTHDSSTDSDQVATSTQACSIVMFFRWCKWRHP